MEELRDLNRASLTAEEKKARDLEMQRSRGTIASGCLAAKILSLSCEEQCEEILKRNSASIIQASEKPDFQLTGGMLGLCLLHSSDPLL